MSTGIFFHSEFTRKDWPVIGDKFARFPAVMKDQLALPEVTLFESREASNEELLTTHTSSYLEQVKKAWYYRGAATAVGGCIDAAVAVASGRLTNALVFSVGAGHHAEPDWGGGGTYLSCTGPAIARVRQAVGPCRIAIVDTDSHHGNGTRAVFMNDPDVLHVCLCDVDWADGTGTKRDVDVGWRTDDESYLAKVRSGFLNPARAFEPFMIFHNFGHDTVQGDYGDRGLSREFFTRLAREVDDFAREVCEGRYVVITHGGYRQDMAEYIFPRVVGVLARA